MNTEQYQRANQTADYERDCNIAGQLGTPTQTKSDIHVPQINRDLWDRRRTLLDRLNETQTSLDVVDSLISALTT